MRLSLFYVVLLLGSAIGQAPGAKVTIAQSGLSYLKDEGVKELLANIKSLSIPNQSGDAGTPIGGIHYDLTSINLHSLSIPVTTLTVVAPVGLRFVATTVTCQVDMNWHYREDSWPHVSDGGSATASISQMTVNVEVAMGDSGGRPTVHVVSTSVNINNFSINLHGGASWLYNLFIGWFEGSIKSSVQSSLVGTINQVVNSQLEKALATLPTVQHIDKWADINFALVTSPQFQGSTLTTDHLAQVVARSNPRQQPWSPGTITEGNYNNMMNIGLSTAVANSAGFTYLNAGILQENITSFPASMQFPLNTTSFATLIPGLAKKYPNTPMMLHAFANSTPIFHTTPAGGVLVGVGQLAFFVVPRGLPALPAFTLGIVVTLKGEVGVKGQNVYGTVSFMSAQLSVVSSPYGPFDVTDLQSLTDQLCQVALVEWLNQRLGVGFALPIIDGVELHNVHISYGTDVVMVGADFTYN